MTEQAECNLSERSFSRKISVSVGDQLRAEKGLRRSESEERPTIVEKSVKPERDYGTFRGVDIYVQEEGFHSSCL